MQRRDRAKRAVGIVWLKTDIMGFCHRRNLLQLQYAAPLNNVGLNHLHDLPTQQVGKFPLGIKPLACRQWNAYSLGNPLHCVEVCWWHGFFVHKGTILGHRIADADGVCRGKPSMYLNEQLNVVAHCFANGFQFFYGYTFGFCRYKQSTMVKRVPLERRQSIRRVI